MSKGSRLYKTFMTSMIVIIAGLLLATGIIAVQKSMKIKMGVSIIPSMLCKITDSNNNVLFCNTTKNSQSLYVTEGASISGNMLTLNKSFSNLGGEFSLKIYNYTTVATSGNVIKVTASGTGVETTSMWLPSYSSGTPTAGEINITAVAGTISLQFEEVAKPSFTVTYNLTNCTKTSGATSITYGNSYSATLTASIGYVLPSAVTVANITTGGYSWNKSTGVCTITDWTKVNGNITVTVIASEAFTFYTYEGSGHTAPTSRDGTAYKYYCEFGTYPQSYVGTDASIVSGMTETSVTYAYNNAVKFYSQNGVNKYALVGSNYYAFEPIRWIVLGVDTSGGITFSGSGTSVTVNTTTATLFNGTNSSKLTLADNRIKFDGAVQNKLLLLSELALDNEYFDKDSSYDNQWSSDDCDVRLFLNTITNDMTNFASISGLYNYYDTSSAHVTGKYIQQTTLSQTSRYNKYLNTSETIDDSTCNMFLLGSNTNYGRKSSSETSESNYYDIADSYNIASYFPLYTGTAVNKLIASKTPYAYACGATLGSGSATSAGICRWWLRSGGYESGGNRVLRYACYVNYDGDVDSNSVSGASVGVRPSFILNLA